jgi:hypothetical protein
VALGRRPVHGETTVPVGRHATRVQPNDADQAPPEAAVVPPPSASRDRVRRPAPRPSELLFRAGHRRFPFFTDRRQRPQPVDVRVRQQDPRQNLLGQLVHRRADRSALRRLHQSLHGGDRANQSSIRH